MASVISTPRDFQAWCRRASVRDFEEACRLAVEVFDTVRDLRKAAGFIKRFWPDLAPMVQLRMAAYATDVGYDDSEAMVAQI